MEHQGKSAVFDYLALRLLMGLIALFIPFIVSWISSASLTSISASYYSEARDAFVGLLFVVGAFLFAYNGHTGPQSLLSKIACIAAVCVAYFPTSCDGCETSASSVIHYASALVLFLILTYFCFVFFQKGTKGGTSKQRRRSAIYFVCGWVMVASILTILIAKTMMPETTVDELRIVYWAEASALFFFGVAWIVSGKYFRLIADEDERLKLFSK